MSNFNEMSGPQLVDAYNGLVAELATMGRTDLAVPVKRFVVRGAGIKRCAALAALVAAARANAPDEPRASEEKVAAPAPTDEFEQQPEAHCAYPDCECRLPGVGRPLDECPVTHPELAAQYAAQAAQEGQPEAAPAEAAANEDDMAKKAKAKKAAKAARPKKAARVAGANGAARGEKQERVLVMLRRANGATVAAVMEATGWLPHTTRAFFSAVVGKKLGLKIKSEKKEGKERVYWL